MQWTYIGRTSTTSFLWTQSGYIVDIHREDMYPQAHHNQQHIHNNTSPLSIVPSPLSEFMEELKCHLLNSAGPGHHDACYVLWLCNGAVMARVNYEPKSHSLIRTNIALVILQFSRKKSQ